MSDAKYMKPLIRLGTGVQNYELIFNPSNASENRIYLYKLFLIKYMLSRYYK